MGASGSMLGARCRRTSAAPPRERQGRARTVAARHAAGGRLTGRVTTGRVVHPGGPVALRAPACCHHSRSLAGSVVPDARPPNLPISMTPKVTWRRVPPADVLSALKTLGPLRANGRIITYKGQDVETLLGWTFSELQLAENAPSTGDKERHASQVVVHAKKALDCL